MKKTIVVTGATGSLGKATALELAKNNCRIILLARNADKLLKIKNEIISATKNNDVEYFVADLSEPSSIRKAVAEIKSKHSSLNGLINTAAIFIKQRKQNSLGHEYMFATNHLGTFLLTNELLDLLKAGKPSRVLTVSAPSTTKVNFDDIHGKQKWNPGFMGTFGATKMMNLLFTYALARRIEGSGVTASVYHPGLMKSELTREMSAFANFIFGMMSSPPEKAAKMLCTMTIGGNYNNSNGIFLKFNGKQIKSNAYSYDRDNQEKLWKMSEEITYSD
ncbi:MAG: SDR family NAD(P)-dependent oxidoreductase [Bacteroidetes bacterium]|nr:SDR family NAD(P)-dependent oxidoreductase [Bacteroidota bacterium]